MRFGKLTDDGVKVQKIGSLPELFPWVSFPARGFDETAYALANNCLPVIDDVVFDPITEALRQKPLPVIVNNQIEIFEVVQRDASAIAVNRKFALKQKFGEIIAAGRVFQGKTYQIDESSLERMHAVFTMMQANVPNANIGYWIDAANNKVQMDDAAIEVFFLNIFAYVQALRHALWTKRELIMQGQDPQLNSGWPAN